MVDKKSVIASNARVEFFLDLSVAEENGNTLNVKNEVKIYSQQCLKFSILTTYIKWKIVRLGTVVDLNYNSISIFLKNHNTINVKKFLMFKRKKLTTTCKLNDASIKSSNYVKLNNNRKQNYSQIVIQRPFNILVSMQSTHSQLMHTY